MTYHVDVPLILKDVNLKFRESSKTEHTDLIGDMVPGSGSFLLLEELADSIPHVNDATAHGTQVLLPFSEQCLVVHDGASDAGTVGGRIRDLGALEDIELRGDALGGLDCSGSGGGDEVEGTDTFTIEAEVLREGLGNGEFEALLSEVADSPGITVQVAGSETLVRAIEEGEMVAGAHGFGDFDPLLLGRVNTGWIVGTGVEDEDGEMGRGENGSNQAVVVQTTGINVEVRVVRNSSPNVLEDLVVVRPGWDRGIESGFWRPWVEAREEQSSEMDRTGSGNGLTTDDLETEINSIVSLPISVEKKKLIIGVR